MIFIFYHYSIISQGGLAHPAPETKWRPNLLEFAD
jgi:hypothetical protein